jgi:hypothetical protein
MVELVTYLGVTLSKKHRSGIYPTTDTSLCFPCCLFHKPTQTHHDPYRLSLCQPRPVVCSTLPRHLSSSRPNLPADKLTTIIKPGLCRSSPSTTNPPPTSFFLLSLLTSKQTNKQTSPSSAPWAAPFPSSSPSSAPAMAPPSRPAQSFPAASFGRIG